MPKQGTRLAERQDIADCDPATALKLADALLLAYTGIRGHLAAPGRIRFERIVDELAHVLTTSGMLKNWLPWDGGDCPLPSSVAVEIMWSDGSKQMTTAGKVAWTTPTGVGLVALPEDLRFVMFYRIVSW